MGKFSSRHGQKNADDMKRGKISLISCGTAIALEDYVEMEGGRNNEDDDE